MPDYFNDLEKFLLRLPAINPSAGKGQTDDGLWWIKFSIDIEHPLAWRVIQELAYVVNYLSVNERLPTTFYPVSPPPYLNGGPDIHLSWVIESEIPEFTPANLTEWLISRLPDPVDDLEQWDL